MTGAFVSTLLARARQRGLRDCLLYHAAAVELQADNTGREEHSETAGLAFEAAFGGRTAGAYTEAFTDEAADFLVESCVENAGIAGGRPRTPCAPGLTYPVLPAPDLQADGPEACRGLLDAARAELARRGPELERSVYYAQSALRTVRVMNDIGLDVSFTGSRFTLMVAPVCLRGGTMENGIAFRGSSRLDAIDVPGLVAEASDRVSGYVGAGRIPTARYDAVFRNEVATYLLQALAVFFSRDVARAGRSRFIDARIGSRVASEALTIVDDPHRDGGLFSTPFDAQGCPTRRKVLVESGVLRDMLCDLACAETGPGADLPLSPGNAARMSHFQPLEVSPTNLSILPGKEPLPALLGRLGTGLFVTDATAYFHGAGVNPVTGDFSLPSKGFVVEGGRIVRPFTNVVVAGNLYDLLLGVEAVASDPIVGLPTSFIPGAPARSGGYESPALLVRGVSVAGE
jgi:PmbA protein